MKNKDNTDLEHVWSVISHDLASPFASLQQNLNYIDKSLLPNLLETYKTAKAAGLDVPLITKSQVESFQRMLNNNQAILDSVRQQITRWNRKLIFKHYRADNQPLEIVKTIKDAINNYQASYSLKDKAKIHIDLADGVVLGDANLIQYIIFELLANAEYAMGADENSLVSISSSKDTDGYHIKIKNKCLPINPEDVEKFFDAYFSNKTSHIGLGLTFCKQAMEHMQGRIACHTEDNGELLEVQLTFRLPSAQ